MKKFLKDTRGVVMMEYIILGCFAVALTLVSVMGLANVYCNGLQTMGYATLGNTQDAVTIQKEAADALVESVGISQQWANDLTQAAGQEAAAAHSFQYYTAQP